MLAVCLIGLGQGSQAMAEVTGLERVQANSDPDLDFVSTKEVQADCPDGKKVVGGGYLLSFFGGATDVPLRLSVPSTDLRSWIVSGTNFNNTPWGLSAIAICADAADEP